MRRFTIGSAIVLALLLMLTAIATATPPTDDWCGDGGTKPDHPSCVTTTTTTTVPEPSTLEPCPTAFDIEVLKPGRVGYECLWTPENPGTAPVTGTVTVTPNDGISSLVVFVRDSSPGDICLLAQGVEAQIGDDGSFVGSFDLSYGSVDDMVEVAGWDPREYPEDERPPSFDPYVDENYWSFGGLHWCYPQDPIASMREDLNGEPLHLWVGFLAKKNAGPVEVSLFPGQATAP